MMQTFLPSLDFARAARVLDRQRLGKQRVECLQILEVLRNEACGLRRGWRNHPAVRMWAGYEEALAAYGQVICLEWLARGYRDACFDRIGALRAGGPVIMPPWMGDPAFHRSHRSNLLRKLPGHYRAFWPRLRDDLPYVWPCHRTADAV